MSVSSKSPPIGGRLESEDQETCAPPATRNMAIEVPAAADTRRRRLCGLIPSALRTSKIEHLPPAVLILNFGNPQGWLCDTIRFALESTVGIVKKRFLTKENIGSVSPTRGLFIALLDLGHLEATAGYPSPINRPRFDVVKHRIAKRAVGAGYRCDHSQVSGLICVRDSLKPVRDERFQSLLGFQRRFTWHFWHWNVFGGAVFGRRFICGVWTLSR